MNWEDGSLHKTDLEKRFGEIHGMESTEKRTGYPARFLTKMWMYFVSFLRHIIVCKEKTFTFRTENKIYETNKEISKQVFNYAK